MQAKAKEEKTKPALVSKATPLPSRLLVSASKQLLDAVAAGKISFEEFRQAATVEWQHFPIAEGKTQYGWFASEPGLPPAA